MTSMTEAGLSGSKSTLVGLIQMLMFGPEIARGSGRRQGNLS